MNESTSEQFGRLKPYILDLIATAGITGRGGTAGGGAVAAALLAAHEADLSDVHDQYRLRAVALDLANPADITGVLPPPGGGTGIPSYAAGDMLYATDATTLARRAIGGTNELLTVAGGVPAWAALSDAMHGDLGGGSLHDAATTLAAGFMSASDKATLDALAAVGGSVGGSGTANRMTRWSDADTIGDSTLWNVGSQLYMTDNSLTPSIKATGVDLVLGNGSASTGSSAPYAQIGFEFAASGGGGLAHFLRTTHGATAAENRLEFWINTSATAADSTRPGVNNDRVMYMTASGVIVGNPSGTSKTLQVTGAVTLDSTLAVTGDSTLTGHASVGGTAVPSATTILQVSAALSTAVAVRGIQCDPTYTLSGASSAQMVGFNAITTINANGNTHSATFGILGGRFNVTATGTSGSVNGAAGFTAQISNGQAGGLTTAVGGVFLAHGISGSGAITNAIGLIASQQTAGTNNTNALIGTQTAPTGNYGIYNASSYDNYFAGLLGLGATSPAVTLHLARSTSATTAVQEMLRIAHNDSSNPGTGFGSSITFKLKSNPTADQDAGAISMEWVTATDAIRAARGKLLANYTTTARECLRWEANSTAAMIGFLGAAAAVRQTGGAATADLTYSANERDMIQAAYDCLRTFGLLT